MFVLELDVGLIYIMESIDSAIAIVKPLLVI